VSLRRHHYERAFEQSLRDRRIPYVSVDDARKALLPEGAGLKATFAAGDDAGGMGGIGGRESEARGGGASVSLALKSFDFVVYSEGVNLLVDVKGRKVAGRQLTGPGGPGVRGGRGGRGGSARLECWATEDDCRCLRVWSQLFGRGFRSAFVFVYWCDAQPPDGLFQEVVEYQARWYAIRAILLDDYVAVMRRRSARWGTVDLSQRDFERLSHPLTDRFMVTIPAAEALAAT
jgi:hypothetical protein